MNSDLSDHNERPVSRQFGTRIGQALGAAAKMSTRAAAPSAVVVAMGAALIGLIGGCRDNGGSGTRAGELRADTRGGASIGPSLPGGVQKIGVDATPPVPAEPPTRGPVPDASGPAKPEPPPAPRINLSRHSGDPTGPIGYVVVEPPGAGPEAPIAIALHGRGDKAERFAALAEQLQLPIRTIVARAPLPFGNAGGRQWYDSRSADRAAQVRQRAQDVAGLIRKLQVRYPGSPRPLVYGFSQGAVVALQVALETPSAIGGVAALSGYLMTEEGAATADGSLPALVIAGTRDTVIAEARSWAAADALARHGHKPERFSFAGPHRITSAALARLRSFLAARLSPAE